MTPIWTQRFMALAETVATWSKDPDRQIGCVIVNPNRRIVATGYNGFPKNVKDLPELLADKNQKRMRMIHAELNAVLNATAELKGSTVYVNRFPCHICAGILVNKEIKQLIVPKPDLGHEHWGSGWKVALNILEDNVEIFYAEGYNSNQ